MEYLYGSKVKPTKNKCVQRSLASPVFPCTLNTGSQTQKPSADHRTARPPDSDLEWITVDHGLMALNYFLASTMVTPILESGCLTRKQDHLCTAVSSVSSQPRLTASSRLSFELTTVLELRHMNLEMPYHWPGVSGV